MQSLGKMPAVEFDKIRNKIYHSDFFIRSNYEVIAKHLLSQFIDSNIFRMCFSEIVEAAKKICAVDDKLMQSEGEFYRFICKEYLEINKLPSQVFFSYFDNAVKDLNEIDRTVEQYKAEVTQIERKEAKEKLEDDTYNVRLLNYYIASNEAAKTEIIRFLTASIRDYVIFDSTSAPQFTSIFYSGIPYSYRWMPGRFKISFLSDLSNKLLELEISTLRDISKEYANGNKVPFYEAAKRYIQERQIVEQIKKWIADNHTLNKRKRIFEEAFDAYNSGSKYLFCSIIPLQIEGLFYDYCLELGIDEESIRSVSLSTKLEQIIQRNPQYSNFEYYTFRFPLIRNKVAHGKLLNENIDDLALYLILDFYDVCKLLISSSLPVNRAVSLVRLAAQDLNDLKPLVRYSLYRNVVIPAFYNVDESIVMIKEKIIEKPFWDYLNRLIDDGSPVLKQGVLKIVTDLKKAEVNPSWCKQILEKLQGVSSSFNEEEFLEQLKYTD